MGLPDKHDTLGPRGTSRLFSHFATVADDGTVLAVIELADDSLTPSTHPDVTDPQRLYVDVTEEAREHIPLPKKLPVQKVNGAKARRDEAKKAHGG